MTQQQHPVFRSLNRPLTLFGAERKLFGAALSTGLGIFILLNTLSAGLLVGLTLYAAAVWATRSGDPHILRIIFRSASYRRSYDPFKREAHMVIHNND